VDYLNSIRVWPTGIHTLLKRIRVILRIIVRNIYFDYLFTFFVLCNTILLSLDAYGISD